MFFTRTHSFHSPLSREELKSRLIGRHIKIHDLDFEVLEREGKLSIIPHAEQISTIKTLPVTSVVMHEANGKTKVVVRSKMRQLDSGGPFLIVLFCTFMLIASGILLFVDAHGDRVLPYTLLGISVFIFTIFCVRMQMGYFDYVRKVRAYVKEKTKASFSEASVSVA